MSGVKKKLNQIEGNASPRTIRMPDQLWEDISRLAEERGEPASRVVRQILEESLTASRK